MQKYIWEAQNGMKEAAKGDVHSLRIARKKSRRKVRKKENEVAITRV